MMHSEDIEDSSSTESPDTEEEEAEYEQSDSTETESSSDMEAEDEGDSTEDDGDELEENATFQLWYKLSLDETKEMRDEKYDKYIIDGMNEEEAKEKAYSKVLWTLQRSFFDKYEAHLWNSFHLKEQETHEEIKAELEERMSDGKDVYKTIKRVMTKHRHKFDGLFLYEESEEETDEENDD